MFRGEDLIASRLGRVGYEVSQRVVMRAGLPSTVEEGLAIDLLRRFGLPASACRIHCYCCFHSINRNVHPHAQNDVYC